MTQYREIPRLKTWASARKNSEICGISRNTVAKVTARVSEMNISWPLDPDMTDGILDGLIFPYETTVINKHMPDFDYIRKELQRNGVNKKLLWAEYCEDCRLNNQSPLMYSQFCHYISKDEEKRRAVAHIPRNPGGQNLEGLPARVFDHTLSPEELAEASPEGYKDLLEKIYKRLSIIPQTFLVDKHHVHVYASKNNDDKIVKASRPANLFRNSIATPSLVAAIINGKYANHLPLDCQSKYYKKAV